VSESCISSCLEQGIARKKIDGFSQQQRNMLLLTTKMHTIKIKKKKTPFFRVWLSEKPNIAQIKTVIVHRKRERHHNFTKRSSRQIERG
jgi:exopolyphosphatase/pppGpp-phosphohydrolase